LATSLQFVNETTVESVPEHVSARNMARFYFAVFWTIIFTGCIRKWMFPGVTALYLTQDIPIGLAYLYALWTGIYTRGVLFMGIALVGVCIMLQACLQLMVSGLDVFVAVIGIHNYLFYLPILLIFPLALTETYRRRFIWWNLMLSLPMCLLVVAQTLSPKQAFVNRTSEGDAFGVPGAEVARVSGTFNFVSFYGIWAGMAVALTLGEWLQPKAKRVIHSNWLLLLCTVAVNVCHLVSASRFTIMLAAIALVGAMVAATMLRSLGAMLAIAGIVIVLPMAAAVAYAISPQALGIVFERFTGDRYVDDGQNRLITGVIGFATDPAFSLVGAGVGIGVDAAHAGNSDAYGFTYTLSENDLTRNVKELGTPIGMFYVLSRLFFITCMVLVSVRLVRERKTPHALPLSFVLMAQSYQGDWTRSAAMSASQVMVGYAFILGALFNPDAETTEATTNDFLMRPE